MWTLHSEDKTIPYVPGYLILKIFIGLGCALNNIQTPQVFTNINVRYMIFKKKMYKNENGSIEHVKAYIYCIICVNNCICSSQKIILALARIIDCNFTIWHLFHSFFHSLSHLFWCFCRTLACIMTDIWKKLWWHWKRTQNSGKSWKKQMSLTLRFLKILFCTISLIIRESYG